jgi:endonuclease-3
MLQLSPAEIDAVIRDSTFHEAKAQQIHDIARIAVEQHGGKLPCSQEVLLSLRGVGPSAPI